MAAKGMFVLAWLYLPLAVAEMVLLWRAHLPVFASIPALVLNLLLLTAAFVLPVMCVAAVTRSIAQAMVVLMIVFAALSVAGTLSALFEALAPRSLVAVQMGIVAVVFAAALVNQYRTRKMRRSFWIMMLAPALTMVLQLTVPGTQVAASGYARATDDVGLAVRFDDNPLRVFGSGSASVQDSRGPLRSIGRSLTGGPGDNVFVHLPLLVSGTQPGTSLSLEGHRLKLTGADGYAWQSPWLSELGMIAPSAAGGEQPGFAEFLIPRKVYDRLSGGPVAVQIDFAVAKLEDEPAFRTKLSTEGETIPGLGFCTLDESYSGVNCRSAFRDPPRFAIESYRKMPCTAADSAANPALGVAGSLEPRSVLPSISPVVATGLGLNSPRAAGYLCPGMPIEFVEKRVVDRSRVEMRAATIDLKRYVGTFHNQ
jgi:hypothetical protein